MSETFKEQLDRLDSMAHHDDDNRTWDLSENDKRAISALLSSYYSLRQDALQALKACRKQLYEWDTEDSTATELAGLAINRLETNG